LDELAALVLDRESEGHDPGGGIRGPPLVEDADRGRDRVAEGESAAKTASVCTGLESPETAVKATTSASVTVRPAGRHSEPMSISSKYLECIVSGEPRLEDNTRPREFRSRVASASLPRSS